MIEIELDGFNILGSPSFISILVGLVVFILMYIFYDTTKNNRNDRDNRNVTSRELEEERLPNNDNEFRIIVALLSALTTWIIIKVYDMYVVPSTALVDDIMIDLRPRGDVVDIRDANPVEGTIGDFDLDNDVDVIDIQGNMKGSANAKLSEEIIDQIQDVVKDNVPNVIPDNNVSNTQLERLSKLDSMNSMNTMNPNVMNINTVKSMKPRASSMSTMPRIPSKSNVSNVRLGNGLDIPTKSLPMFNIN